VPSARTRKIPPETDQGTGFAKGGPTLAVQLGMTFLLYLLTGWSLLSIVAGLFIGQVIRLGDIPGDWNGPNVLDEYNGPVLPARGLNASDAAA
jgi:hypothetical protein